MPTPYIELPSIDELFNRQQDNTTLPLEEDLDSAHEFNSEKSTKLICISWYAISHDSALRVYVCVCYSTTVPTSEA